MLEAPKIQWFPGHMTKTRRLMEKNLKLVDIVVELLDARVPQSSRNPEIDRLLGGKPRSLCSTNGFRDLM
jgi:ribosome biogenesis GTPase A